MRELAEQGVKEAVLIAQDSTYYGIDLGLRDGLAHLFDAIVERAPDVMWLRLMYAYPTQVTQPMIDTMARHPQVARIYELDELRGLAQPFRVITSGPAETVVG